ncbi:MAG TPA: S41 family peptidase, partial [Gemmataceae bacterium]|nr:S41 family peptidase [Gemmataceae bacterium]
SPDGKWIVYARMNGSLASEVYIIPTDGKAKGSGINVTHYATFNGDVTWSHNGKKIAFISQRRNHVGMYVLSLEKPAAAGVRDSRGIHIDWEDIQRRVHQAGPLPAEEGAISPDGSKVAFRSVGVGGTDLWVASSNGGSLRRLTTGANPRAIQWSHRSSEVIYFRDGNGALRVVRASGSGDVTVPFRVKLTVRRDEEFREMFEQSWRALREHFYDPKFHGADWYAVRKKYEPLVKQVALKEDLYALISLMMGELNASHLGIQGDLSSPDENTADLGLVFDETYQGPGLKVAEILKGGPADKRGLKLKAGDVILGIDRVKLTDRTNISQLLNDKVGETVILDVASAANANPKKSKTASRRVEIQAAGRDRIARLMYDRWVDHNAKRVAQLSHGKLGYIHIPNMLDSGLDQFVRALYSDNFDKDGIVLDVRYNGGGWTHDQVLNYLTGHEHTIFRQRNGGEGLVLRSVDRKWSKPLVLLINNRSYSDAEIFPSAFRTLGLGKLVGQATGGHVIGTSAVQLIDGSIFRIPQIGVFTIKGVDMEEHGVVPDVVVDQTPDQQERGEDPQLDTAARVLAGDVLAWKEKHHPNVASTAQQGKRTGSTEKTSTVRMPLSK